MKLSTAAAILVITTAAGAGYYPDEYHTDTARPVYAAAPCTLSKLHTIKQFIKTIRFDYYNLTGERIR